MRVTTATAAAVLCLSARIAKADDDPPELNTIVTPDSPAFVLLGVSPTQVQRPTDPKAFAAAVVPAILTSGGVSIPPGFALEVAPYWWQSHPTLTLEDYKTGNAGALLRNLSISVASSPASTSAGTGTTAAPIVPPRVAFGVRTTIWHGSPARGDDPCDAELRATAKAVEAGIAEAIRTGQLDPTDESAVKAKQKEIASAQAPAQKCAKVLSSRRYFEADLAGAYALALPDNQGSGAATGSVRTTQTSGYGAWLTANWIPTESISLLGVARYLAQGIEGAAEQRDLDFGLRFAYAWSRFGVGLEGIYRDYLKSPNSDKYAVRIDGTFDLLVTENTWVTLMVGRDYSPFDRNPILSLAGVKWNIDAGANRSVVPTQYASTASAASSSAPSAPSAAVPAPVAPPSSPATPPPASSAAPAPALPAPVSPTAPAPAAPGTPAAPIR